MRTQTLTLLLSDLQGYTARQARSSREEQARDLALHERLLRPVFAAFAGDVVKTMGDAFLACFESPTDAVLAAVQVHKQLEAHNRTLTDPTRALAVRIGIATGEVARDDAGDVFGDAVNLAARLQQSAEPGAIWLAEATFLSMNRNEVQAFEVGARVFKGVPDEVKVYRVLDAWLAAQPVLSAAELHRANDRRERTDAPSRRSRTLAAGILGAIAFAVLVAWLWRGTDSRTPRERYLADPQDLASADAWLADEATSLFAAEAAGTMQTVYREGRIATLLRDLAGPLGTRASFRALQLVYALANEPLAPGVAALCLEVLREQPALGRDERFRTLLRSTAAYAEDSQSDLAPAARALYREALAALPR